MENVQKQHARNYWLPLDKKETEGGKENGNQFCQKKQEEIGNKNIKNLRLYLSFISFLYCIKIYNI